MGCQVGVEPANMITAMKTNETTSTKSYETIKLGIDAHAKWYYVARQLDGATPQPVQKMDIDGRNPLSLAGLDDGPGGGDGCEARGAGYPEPCHGRG
jgi:hypothetical protein